MNRITINWVFTFLFGVVFCGSKPNVPPPNLNFVIFDSNSPETVSIVTSVGFGEKPLWTPSEQEIQDLESLLPQFLKDHPAKNGKIVDMNNYGRQYFGCTRNGKQVIYLNAFCHVEMFKDIWKRDIVLVMDGGECYFQAYYDPAAKTFIGIKFNGYA